MKPIKLLLVLIFNSLLSAAQPAANPVLYTISEKDGLTDNTANCFFQDSRGVMWIGTNYGLNSFDGSVIRNFHAGNDEQSLANDAVNDIKEDDHQQLWIATGNGLSQYNLQGKIFATYRNQQSGSDKSNRFYSLAIAGGDIYLATEEGLVLFNLSSKHFSRYLSADAAAGFTNRIVKVFADREKRIWLATYNGLWQFDPLTKQFINYDNEANDPLFDGLVYDIYEDHAGIIWFGTWSKGLKSLDPSDKKITTYLHYSGSTTNLVSIAEQKANDGSRALMVSTNLSKIDTLHKRFEIFPLTNTANNQPLTANRLFCDRSNLLWISTNQGVRIYNPAKQYFNNHILSTYVPLTSQGISLLPLNGQFLMGGEGGTSLMLFNDSLRMLQNLSAKINTSAAVMNIQKDEAGLYWISTSNGLIISDSTFTKKQLFIHNDKDPASLPKNFLNGVLHKKDGNTWILPWRKGVWQFDINSGKSTRVLTAKGDTLLAAANLSRALEDKNGNTWFTDYSAGLYKYEPASGQLLNIFPSRRLSNECLLGDTLWTISSTEILAVDIYSNAVYTCPLPPGKNKYEYDFIPDGKGFLWIATKTGLLAFDMQRRQFKIFLEDDGLLSNNMDVSFARLSNGEIIYAAGTYAGTFSPGIVQQNAAPAALLFTGALAEGREKEMEHDHLDIAWNEKNISLNWALLNYSNPLGNQYYYRLDGVDKDWQTAGNKGSISYNSLEAGTYLFHYKAATSEGLMSEEKTIRLLVHPPFWKTGWFIILGLLIVAGLFAAVIRYISQRNLKERLLKLEKEQAVEKERNRISRDMHDELGSGLTRIAILSEVIKKQKDKDPEQNVNRISETARSLVDNLDEMVWALNPKNDSLDKLAAYIAEYANQFLDGTGIDCEISLPEVINPLYISEEKRRNIFMAVKEFLNNTVKHSGAGSLRIELQQSANQFTLSLADNGKGFDAGKLNNMGNGLRNMRQRIADIGGTVQLSSSAKGTELKINFIL